MSKAREMDRQFDNVLGLKESDAKSNKPPGSVNDILNMYYDNRGGRKSRNGYVKGFYIGEASELNCIHDYSKSDGTQVYLVTAGTKFFQVTTAEVVSQPKWVDGTTPALTADVKWTMTQYIDRVYMANGTDAYMVYDGSEVFNLGIAPPSGALTLAVRAGGTLAAGEYHYYYTFYNSEEGWESNPYGLEVAATSETTAAANLTIRLTLLAKADAKDKVTDYRIYRSAKNVATDFTMVAALDYATYEPVAGTGLYDDTGLADGTIALAYDNNKPAADGWVFALWQERLYTLINDATYGPILAYSKNDFKVGGWPTTYFLPLAAPGANGKWLDTYRKILVVYSSESVEMLDTDPQSSGYLKQISSVGIADKYAAASTDKFVAYLSLSGFNAQAPTRESDEDLRIETIGKDISKHTKSINWGQTDEIRCHRYETDKIKHLYWAIPYDAATEADYIYAFDYNNGQWTIYKLGHTVTAFATIKYGGKDVLWFGDKSGYAWRFDEDALADGIDDTAANLNGTATSGATTTITDTGKAWTVNGLAGMYVTVLSGTNSGESKLIASNTATAITCAAFTAAIDTTSVYSVGAYDKFCEEFWNSNKYPEWIKRIRWQKAYLDEDTACEVTVTCRKDMSDVSLGSQTVSLTGSTGSFPLTFPVIMPSGSGLAIDRLRFSGKFHFCSTKYRNQRAGDYFGLDGYSTVYQPLYDRTQ